MKRSPSSEPDPSLASSHSYNPSPSPEIDSKPVISGSPTTPKKPKFDKATTTPKKSPKTKAETNGSPGKGKASGSNGNGNCTWDNEKRMQFMDEVIAVGYKHADLDSMAGRLGLNKRQLVDQLVPNKSNMRKKAVAGAAV